MLKSLLLGGVSLLPLFNVPGEGSPGAGDPPVNDPPAGDPPAEGSEGNDPPADPPAEGAEGEKPPAVVAPTEDWRDREIRRKHAQLQESKRREAEKDAELTALRAIAERTGGAEGEKPPASPAAAPKSGEIPDDVRQQAIAQVRFDEGANAADKAGKERYGADWKAATDNLALKGGFDVETMNGILATDDPAKVLYELGKNPDRYDELMGLPPHKRLAAMVKMGMPTPKAAVKPSNAPPPPSAIGGRQQINDTTLRDDLNDDDWYARRQAQKKARYEARRAAR